MSANATLDASRELNAKSPWPKRLIIIMAAMLPFGLLFQLFVYYKFAGSRELHEAMAEAERLDSGWRTEDVEARRRRIPDSENSAFIVQAVGGLERPGTSLLPKGWESEELQRALENVPPQTQLNERQIGLIRDSLKQAEVGLKHIRQVADMPYGRFPITYSRDGISTLLPHLQGARYCAKLLEYDARLRAQEGKMDDAIQSCRISINCSRSIGDEPCLISMLVRLAARSITLHSLERVLAQGQASETSLAALQKLLEQDAEEPLMLWAMRGERAMADRLMDAIQTGDIDLRQAMMMLDAPGAHGFTGYNGIDETVRMVVFLYQAGPIKKNRAALLRIENQMVEIAKKPLEDQWAEFDLLEKGSRNLPLFARGLIPAVTKVMDANYRSQAELRSMTVALAAERYRLATGEWPKSADDLTPKYLSAIPRDPYVTSPLNFKQVPDGLVIYSVGRDRKDDGGNLDRRKGGFEKDSDMGVQLWSVDKRRQPAKPSLPTEPEDSP